MTALPRGIRTAGLIQRHPCELLDGHSGPRQHTQVSCLPSVFGSREAGSPGASTAFRFLSVPEP